MAYLAISSILRGKKAGDRMPSYQELKAQLSVPYRSIDLAYQRLEYEGVLERRWGRGTYVLDPFAGGTFVYITHDDFFITETGAYSRLEYLALNDLVRLRYPKCNIELMLTQARHPEGQTQRKLDVCTRIRALQHQMRFLGVISGYTFWGNDIADEFARLNLPLVDLGNPRAAASVFKSSATDSARIGLQHLIEEGWRDIAIVSAVSEVSVDEIADGHRAASGATIAMQRMTVPDFRTMEDVGAAHVKELLRHNTLPRAFLITDDLLCMGMLYGALEEGVKLADRCAIVTVSNEGIPIRASRAITRLEFSPAVYAAEVMRLMELLFDGQVGIKSAVISPTLKIGQSSRKADYSG
jgi:DNA-binding LacI/PurR family transcriptional regulator